MTVSGTNKAFRNESGFTLVEVTVALGIISLVTAIAVTSIGSIQRTLSERLLVQSIESAFWTARFEALTFGRPTGVTMDIHQRRISFGSRGAIVILPETAEPRFRGSERGLQSGDQATVTFYPDGTSSGGEVVIHIAGTEIVVGAEWMTGRIYSFETDAAKTILASKSVRG